MKFGGTSLADSRCLRNAAQLIVSYASGEQEKAASQHRKKHQPVVVIASAMSGVTDQLIEIYNLSIDPKRQEEQHELLDVLKARHTKAVAELELDTQLQDEAQRQLDTHLSTLAEWINQHRPYDDIISFGERLSSFLLSQAVKQTGIVSTDIAGTEVIATDEAHGAAHADMETTSRMASEVLKPLYDNKIVPIITGFFGRSPSGQITILGRGGSDYSAAIIAAALDANRLIIWKEVNGIYTADPLTHPDATFLEQLSYEKAAQMARAGAKVLHPETMEPVRQKSIPVTIKNTFYPDFPGTTICS